MVFTLTDDQRYRALRARDRRFDGHFIVGVRTTGIYCRPSCPTPVHPLRKNVDFYPSTAAAQRAGLRACKRCRPDACPGSPVWNVRGDLVARAVHLITEGWLDTHNLGALANRLGVTERHLRRLVTEELGAPPLAIARAHRSQTARTLIETTTMSFTEISFASGFGSLRQFNDTIRKVFDASPTDLRRQAGSSPTSAGRLSLRLPFRPPFAAEHLFGWWAKRAIPGVMATSPPPSGGVPVGLDPTTPTIGPNLTVGLRLPNGAGVAWLYPEPAWVRCDLELDDLGDLSAAVAQCRALLDLDADPTAIDTTLRGLGPIESLVDVRPGLRMPGSSDGFATLVFAILGQQRSVAAARTLAGRLVERVRQSDTTPAGHRVDDPTTTAGMATSPVVEPFPPAQAVAGADLSGLGLNRRAIDTIASVARCFTGREDELGPASDRTSIRDELLAIKGIGPWTADYVEMRIFSNPDVLLRGDLIVDRMLDRLGLAPADAEKVRPWRTYLTHHLWAASEPPTSGSAAAAGTQTDRGQT